jgi:hypothetical protein
MTRLVHGLAFVMSMAGLALAPAKAVAQPLIDPAKSMVDIEYGEPIDPVHKAILARLKKREVLEDFRDFLSPLKLPSKLLIRLAGCNGTINAWYSAQSITICYEYIDWIRQMAATTKTDEGITPEDAVVGPFVDVLLHELSHAVIDMLKVPVLGREEDAADAVAAFILVQFGKEVARRTITGSAMLYLKLASSTQVSNNDYSDVHGLAAQRFYNVLCIGYGWDHDLFNDFVQKGYLPRERASSCTSEYEQILYAYRTLIAPHVDLELQKLVQSKQWLKPDDGK